MAALSRRNVGFFLLLLALAAILPSEVAVFIDPSGRTWLSDKPPEGARALGPDDLAVEWGGKHLGEPLPRGTSSHSEEDRYLSAVLAARSDVQRGDLQAGLRALRRLVRDEPSRPEAPLLLARIERRRGRLEAARDALDTMLGTAGRASGRWRDAAIAERTEIEQELALAKANDGEEWRTRSLESTHFLVTYDHQFAGREYGEQVVDTLERARAEMLQQLGRELSRPLEVKLYTRAHYLEAYQHRFGFATVGFYDGAIHVVSARRPRNELYALVVHEYVHALWKEAVGTHQPFFLNEGLADRAEEAARGRPKLSREEWRRLLEAQRSGEWIALDSLVQGFGNVRGAQALLAYLESRAAIELIETRREGSMAGFLRRSAAGERWQDALVAETGWDVAGLERALQAEVRSRFPADPLAAASAP